MPRHNYLLRSCTNTALIKFAHTTCHCYKRSAHSTPHVTATSDQLTAHHMSLLQAISSQHTTCHCYKRSAHSTPHVTATSDQLTAHHMSLLQAISSQHTRLDPSPYPSSIDHTVTLCGSYHDNSLGDQIIT